MSAPVLDDAQAIASLRRVRAAYAPPPKLTVSEFADAHIIVTTGPLAGTRWQTAFAPYQRGIMDAFHEPGVQGVVVMGSSQWGKTACMLNVAAYHMAHDPCPMLIVEPTLKPMAEEFAVNRLEPLIAATPILFDKVAKKRAKAGGKHTTLEKTFRGGHIAIAGANSASSLAARPIRVLLMDEVDRWPLELPGEGSTIRVAMKRTQAYGRRRRWGMFSSPTIIGAPIHEYFQRGDQRYFFVPCPNCDHMHRYEWANLKWNSKTNDPSTARLHCPSCEYGIDDAERLAILSGGEWVATNPDRRDKSIVSMHMWEAYSPLSTLAQIVGAFLDAREKQKAGDEADMHTWQNTTLGEPREEVVGKKVEPDMLYGRRELYDPIAAARSEPPSFDVPDGACCLTMGVDVQDDRLEALVFGWGPGEESWIVDRQTLPGDTSQPEPWRMLDELLALRYRHAFGMDLGIQSTCIDSAGHRTALVYDFAFTHAARRVYATIGRDGERPIVSSPSPKRWGRPLAKKRELDREVPLYTIGVDEAKRLITSRLAETEKGAGYIHLPATDWCDEELIKQLTSERLITTHHRGKSKIVWRKIRARNEGLDLAILALAAMRLLNPRLDQMWDNLYAMRPKDPPPQPPSGGTPPATPSSSAPAFRRPHRRIVRSTYLGR